MNKFLLQSYRTLSLLLVVLFSCLQVEASESINPTFANSTAINKTVSNFHEEDTVHSLHIEDDVEGKNHLLNFVTRESSVFHLFSHGRSGKLRLDGQWLNSEQIAVFLQSRIQKYKHINIYGCEFAKGEKGKQAIAFLEEVLGLTISASDDITGKDGDWELEVGIPQANEGMDAYAFNLQSGCAGVGGGTNPTDDFDRDGVCNNTDIDDDNDGVPDATESPDCFYSKKDFESGNRVANVTVTTGLEMNSTYRHPNELVDGDSGTGSTSYAVEFINSQSNINANVYTFEFSRRVELSNIYLQYVNNNSHFINGAVVKLRGSNNGTSWTDLNTGGTYNQANQNSVVSIAGSASIYHHKFAVTQNQGRYKYYQIYGVSGTIWSGGYSNEVYFELASTFNSSLYPKANCSSDLDNDGIFNHHDLDSDGDGCSDSYESGAITSETANHQFTGTDSSSDGLVDVVDNGTNGGTAQDGFPDYTSTYNPYALSKNINLCGNLDNDDTLDLTDIDDDNDGVLDATESPDCFYSKKDFESGNRVANVTVTTGLEMNSTYRHPNELVDGDSGTGSTSYAVEFINSQSNINANVYTFEFSRRVELSNIYLQYVNNNSHFINGAVVKLRGSNNGTSWTDLNTGGTYNQANQNSVVSIAGSASIYHHKFAVTQNQGRYKYYQIYGVSGTIWSGGYSNEVYFELASTFNSSLYPKANCSSDLDNDGIFNHHDLDSDGDGCSDSYESGAITSETANHQFTGTDSSSDGLVDVVDNGTNGGTAQDGFPDYTSTYNPYALSKNINLCGNLDNDDTLDLTDIDDDNDGVLDATESPDCFYSKKDFESGNRVANVTVTTGLEMNSTYRHPNELVDGDSGTGSTSYAVEFINSQSNINANVYTFEFSRRVELSNIYLQYVNNNSHFINGAVVKLRGSNNGTSWTDLNTGGTYNQANQNSVVSIAGSASIYHHKFAVTQNQGRYKYYQIYGVSGTIWSGGYSNEVYFELASTFNSSLYPKANCSSDLDNDGIFNHHDLDSDGDGCSDSYESGAITSETANHQFTGTDSSSDGLVDVVDNGTNGGTAQDGFPDYEHLPYAYFKKLNRCIDTDGDTVSDIIDIDDDNDGIIDTDEQLSLPCNTKNCTSWVTIPTAAGTSNPTIITVDGEEVSYTITSNMNVTTQASSSWLELQCSTESISGLPYWQRAATKDHTITFNFSKPVTNFQFVLSAIENTESVQVTTNNTQGNQNICHSCNKSRIELVDANTINVIGGGSNAEIFNVNGPVYTTVSVKLKDIGGAFLLAYGICNLNREESRYANIDTDNDTIPNHLDLDSDGDGCSDAIEGGAGITTANIQDIKNANPAYNGGNSGTDYTGISTNPVYDYLGKTSNTQGSPILKGIAVQQTIGNSQNIVKVDNECISCNSLSGNISDTSNVGISNASVSVYADFSNDGDITANDILLDKLQTDTSGNYSYTKGYYLTIADNFEGDVFSGINNSSGSYKRGWIDAFWSQSSTSNSGISPGNNTQDNFSTNTKHIYIHNVTSVSRKVNLSNITGNVYFSFDYDIDNTTVDVGDQFYFQVSTNGTDFTTLYTYTHDGVNAPVRTQVVNLSAYANTSELTIRFFSAMATDEKVWIDNPTISTKYPQLIFQSSPAGDYAKSTPEKLVLSPDTITCTGYNFKWQTTCEVNPIKKIASQVTAVSCYGGATGGITLTGITGGVAPYSYSWSGPSITDSNKTSEDLTKLKAGNYTVVVTDSKGCILTQGFSVSEPNTALSLSIDETDATESGSCSNGSAKALVSGGTSGYTYQWYVGSGITGDKVADAKGGNTATISGLSPGTYTVEVTDANGCTITQSTIIECTDNCDTAVSQTSVTHVSCKGDSSGSVTVTASSKLYPSATFTFSWSDSQGNPIKTEKNSTTSMISGQKAGTYTVSVTRDGTSCVASKEDVVISEPSSKLSITTTGSGESIQGANDGTAEAVVSGGTPDYTYQWYKGSDTTGAQVADTKGGTTAKINDLSPGTYTVKVTDAKGCTQTASFDVSAADCKGFAISTTSSSVLCQGGTSGSATVQATGGTGSYTYQWYKGSVSTGTQIPDSEDGKKATITGLSTGDYTVLVSSRGSTCTAEATVTIQEPQAISIGATVGDVFCKGASTGAIDLTVSGGTVSYSYVWKQKQSDDTFTDFATTEDLSSLAAGTYKVTVTDGNSCSKSKEIMVTEPSASLAIDSSSFTTAASCYGQATGGITLTGVTGGVAPYSYSWSGPSITDSNKTSEDLTDIKAGYYTVVVTDSRGCAVSQSFSVSEPNTALSLSIDETDATTSESCSNGSAKALVSGGSSGYTYQWYVGSGITGDKVADTKGGNTATISGLSPGTYTVEVTDANGCTITQSTIIECTDNCDTAVSQTSVTHVSCKGDSSGSVTVSASSKLYPSASFTFSWSDSQGNPIKTEKNSTNSTISNQKAGTYTVSVTRDGTSCVASKEDVVISEPSSKLSITTTGSGESIQGANDGTAEAVVSGGTPDYTYQWYKGSDTTGAEVAVSEGGDKAKIDGLSPGTYTVKVTDAKGCTQTASFDVSAADCKGFAISTSSSSVSCQGGSSGSATVQATGGTGSYAYQWYKGSVSTGTQIPESEDGKKATITGLSAGDYTVRVSSTGSSCTADARVTIREPQAISIGATVGDASCKGSSTGSIDPTVSGGTGAYTYSWTSSNGFSSTTEVIDALAAGTYEVTVTDANGCSATRSFSVSEPAASLAIDSSSFTTAASCYGQATGGITLTGITGGVAPYSYSWSGPSITDSNKTSEDLTKLKAGNYTVVVTDSKGCILTQGFSVSEPNTALSLSIDETDATESGSCSNGSAKALVSGGTSGYTYQWYVGSGITGDKVADAKGGNTATISGLSPGTYTVEVTDANGCTITQSTIIECTDNCDTAVSQTSVTHVSCKGDSSGSVTVTASSKLYPSATFTFSWSDSQGNPIKTEKNSTTSMISGQKAGTYTVSVTRDGTSCVASKEDVVISEPSSKLSITTTGSGESIQGANDGTAEAVVSGGTPDYTYQWYKGSDTTGAQVADTKGGTTAKINDLSPGTYTVKVTDAKGCTQTASFDVSAADCKGFAISTTSSSVLCQGGTSGSATVQATGGTGSYTYQWYKGSVSTGTQIPDSEDGKKATITGLSTGDYTVLVSSRGSTCTAEATVTIQEPQAISIGATVGDVFCKGASTGAIDLTVSGGTVSYSYVWKQKQSDDTFTDFATTEDLSSLAAGTYKVTVTDGNSCSKSKEIMVTEPAASLAIDSSSFTTAASCYGQATGGITLTGVTGGVAPYSYSWSGPSITASNKTSEDLTKIKAGNYTVAVTDSRGCTVTKGFSVSEPNTALSLSIDETDATESESCSNGSAKAVVNGGTSDYTYQWYVGSGTTGNKVADAKGGNTASISGLSKGTYTVLITDANGCTITQSTIIECTDNCDTAVSQTSVIHVSCKGDSSGSVTVSASSKLYPSASFTFSWSDSQGNPIKTEKNSTNSTISNQKAGTYTVSVTRDGTSCVASKEDVVISEPSSKLSITTTGSGESIQGANDGTAEAVVSGGTPDYTYQWYKGSDTTGAEVAVSEGGDKAKIDGLSPGTYTVKVTDAKGCTQTASFDVSAADCKGFAISTSSSSVSCQGGSSGSATVQATGGTGSYAYQWYKGSVSTGTQIPESEDGKKATITGLSAGDYTVRVSSTGSSCTADARVTIREPQAISIGATVGDASCKGSSTGSIDPTVSGGTGAYTYSWTSSNGFSSTTEVIDALAAGTYEVTVTDANGCSATRSFSVSEPAASLAIDSSSFTTAASCYGQATGGITLTGVTGGVAPYSYSWSGPSITASNKTSEDLTKIKAGNYTVAVTDSRGCTVTKGFSVSEPNTALSLSIDETDATESESCSNGSAKAVVNGGTSDYTYQWYVGSGTTGNKVADAKGGNTASISGLSKGTYTVLITDANGCTISQSTIIECTDDCDTAVSQTSVTNVSCKGDSSGSVTVSASSKLYPSASFTFSWSDSQGNPIKTEKNSTNSTISNQKAGTYTVSVTRDGTSCVASKEDVVISEPSSKLSITTTGSGESIQGANDGTAEAVVSGGTPDYTYQWYKGSDTTGAEVAVSEGGDKAKIDGLSPGTYTVKVTDAKGCTQTASFEVSAGDCNGLAITTTSSSVSCQGGSSGSATVQATGGTGSYTYQWYVGSDTTGTAVANTQGGDTATITELSAGDYTVVVSSTGSSCRADASVTVQEPQAISIGATVGDVFCKGSDTGAIDLTVSGGTASYSYQWEQKQSDDTFTDLATTQDLSSLKAGTYKVTVTDGNSCTATRSFTVSEPAQALDVSVIAQEDLVCTNSELSKGSIQVTVSGGAGEYTFAWTGPNAFSSKKEDLSNLSQGGLYKLTVTDINGCISDILEVELLSNCTYAKQDFNNTFVNQSVSGNVLTNDSDLEGDTQTITKTGPFDTPNGSVTINSDGSYVYTPKKDFVGADEFEYQVCDDNIAKACDIAMVFIEVLAPTTTEDNTPPIANPDTAKTYKDVAVSGNIVSNDFDQDNDPLTVSQTSVITDKGGQVSIDPKTGVYTYTPPAGFTGKDTFIYEICDDKGACDTTVVTITVIENLDNSNTTSANDDAYNSDIGLPIEGNVLDNDFDAQGDNQSPRVIKQPISGTVVLLTDGSFTYTPSSTLFTGIDSFVYELCDDGSPVACDKATVILSYNGDSPELVFTKLATVSGNGSLGDVIEYTFSVQNTGSQTAFNVTIEDATIGVSGLEVSPLNIAPGETATAKASYTITAQDVAAGKVENSAEALGKDKAGNPVSDVSDNGNQTKDDNGDGDPGNDPTIVFTNDAPIAKDDIKTVPREDIQGTGDTGIVDLRVDILDNDDFRSEGSVGGSISLLTNPTFGVVTMNDNGTPEDPGDDYILYSSNKNIESGDELEFDYQICDPSGDCSSATVRIIFQVVGAPECDKPEIYNVLTPNDDGKNDYFYISNIICFPNNSMQIFNLWGVKVYETEGYGSHSGNVFRGYSFGRVTINSDKKLPVGVYYYLFNYTDTDGNRQQLASYVYLQY